ncbi:MAG: DUF4465 domain-containing protein [Crocosphaera sp.]
MIYIKPLIFNVLVLGGLLASNSVLAQSVIDFEDLPLAPESFNNGSDGSGGFTSRGAFFNNNFNSDFNSWSGWSYSNTTDTTTPGFVNQFSAFTGEGFGGSSNYGVAFSFNPGDSRIILPERTTPLSMQITNTTYAALSMLNGDQFGKVFGGQTGDDPDFFLLTITGLNASDEVIGTIDFYLADYRFSDNSQDFIVDTWNEVDLTNLKGATSLSFALTSSDLGTFGINTPAYFAVDNLVVSSVPESTSILSLLGLATVGTVSSIFQKKK